MIDKKIEDKPAEKKILLIEGDFINSYMIKQYLENDFKMLYARDSHEVIKIMNEQVVDLVLLNTDYENFGLSTNDLVKYIKNSDIHNNIKIVALPSTKNENNLPQLELDAALTQPFSKDEIVENIGKILNN